MKLFFCVSKGTDQLTHILLDETTTGETIRVLGEHIDLAKTFNDPADVLNKLRAAYPTLHKEVCNLSELDSFTAGNSEEFRLRAHAYINVHPFEESNLCFSSFMFFFDIYKNVEQNNETKTEIGKLQPR